MAKDCLNPPLDGCANNCDPYRAANYIFCLVSTVLYVQITRQLSSPCWGCFLLYLPVLSKAFDKEDIDENVSCVEVNKQNENLEVLDLENMVNNKNVESGETPEGDSKRSRTDIFPNQFVLRSFIWNGLMHYYTNYTKYLFCRRNMDIQTIPFIFDYITLTVLCTRQLFQKPQLIVLWIWQFMHYTYIFSFYS